MTKRSSEWDEDDDYDSPHYKETIVSNVIDDEFDKI